MELLTNTHTPKKRTFFLLKLVPKYTRSGLGASLLISLLILMISVAFFPGMQKVIPVFYTLPASSQHLAPKVWVFLFPTFSWFISLAHLYFVKLMQKMEPRILQFFVWSTLVVQLTLLLILVRLVVIIS